MLDAEIRKCTDIEEKLTEKLQRAEQDIQSIHHQLTIASTRADNATKLKV